MMAPGCSCQRHACGRGTEVLLERVLAGAVTSDAASRCRSLSGNELLYGPVQPSPMRQPRHRIPSMTANSPAIATCCDVLSAPSTGPKSAAADREAKTWWIGGTRTGSAASDHSAPPKRE